MNNKGYYINDQGEGIIDSELVAIPEYAFAGKKELRYIHIPAHVVAINERAFENCENLISVTFDEGLKSIGHEAFLNCSSLKELCLPDSVEDVGCNVFCGTGIVEPVFNASHTILCYYPDALSDTYFRVPSTVREIMPTTFGSNTCLKDVYLPEGVEKLHPNTFYNCYVKRVIIPKTVYDLRFGFYNCPDLREIILEGKTSIDYAFEKCPDDIQVVRKRITATSRIYDVYSPLTNLTDIFLPEDISYTKTEEFECLARRVADNDIESLAMLSSYFWKLHFHYPNDFFVWAAQFWNYQHSILSYSPKPTSDILPVDANYECGDKLIAGNFLHCLGLIWFSPETVYRFHSTNHPNIVLVSSPCIRGKLLESYDNDDLDGKARFDWTYMDNHFLTPLGETLYRYSYYDPMDNTGRFLEAGAEAVRILKKNYTKEGE